MKTTKYALIQKGWIILSIGETKEETLLETCQYTRTTPETLDYVDGGYQSANDGDLVLVECTQRLYEAVCKHGGDVLFDVFRNVADIQE